MQPLSLDLGAQLLFHLSITELAAGVDECSDCGIVCGRCEGALDAEPTYSSLLVNLIIVSEH
jgi:hypothetical protein